MTVTQPHPWVWTVLGERVTEPWNGPQWHRVFLDWVERNAARTTGRTSAILAAHRGASKSTLLELVACWSAVNGHDPFILYVRPSFDLANAHVATVREWMLSQSVLDLHPDLHVTATVERIDPRLAGRSRSRPWTASVLSGDAWRIEAVGLLQGVRGLRAGEHRPTLCIIDDIDSPLHSAAVNDKLLGVLTDALIPAMDLTRSTVVWAGNTPTRSSLLARRLSGDLDVLQGAEVFGPYRAVNGPVRPSRGDDGLWRVDWDVAEPHWSGFGREAIEQTINDIGPSAFAREFQFEHDSADSPLPWNPETVEGRPDGARWCRGWDLAGTAGPEDQRFDINPDWTVGVLAASHRGRLFVADPIAVRRDTAGVLEVMDRCNERDATSVVWAVPVDPGSAGKHWFAQLKGRWPGRRVVAASTAGSKLLRSHVLEDVFQAGRVTAVVDRSDGWVGCRTPWVLMERQVGGFPHGAHDDFVDALGDAVRAGRVGSGTVASE